MADSKKSPIDIDINDIDINGPLSGEEEIPSDVSESEDVENVTNPSEIDEDDIAIQDKKSPIVMLFGPRSSGKSMTLVRLSRYLRDNGYIVVVDEMFKSDASYKEKCKKFAKDLNTTEALAGNAYTDFLLIKIVKNGRTICQILEAPGEHYFDPENVEAANFPPYMTEMICTMKNRKIWAFITEANWNVNHATRRAYVERIRNCRQMLVQPTDRFVILYNKVDQNTALFKDGNLLQKPAEEAMRTEFEGIEKIFKNPNPITSLWNPYTYRFVPFCTGHYFKDKGKLKYKKSADQYPQWLWKALLKCIKG